MFYLSNEQTTAMAKPLESTPKMALRGSQFFPRILPITVGSTVEFPNKDDTFHTIFSYSPTKKFD